MKKFTAEYAAMLVDEHLFSWQSPLSELLAGGSLVLSPDASKITLERSIKGNVIFIDSPSACQDGAY